MMARVQVKCEHCKSVWELPDQISLEITEEFARLSRERQPMKAMIFLRTQLEISLRDAKAVYSHLAYLKDQCHRCHTALEGDDIVICSNCKSLNYNW